MRTKISGPPKGRQWVIVRGRRRELFKLNVGGNFHVRFNVRGRDLVRSLGTDNLTAAKAQAIAIIDAEHAGDVTASRALKQRSDYSTVRQLADVYLAEYGTDALKKKTARGNIGCLEKIVRLGTPNELNLEQARTNILTGELVRAFEKAELNRVQRDPRGNMEAVSELRVRTSVCSVVRQARSITKPATMFWFEGLVLPDLRSWREQGVTAGERPKPAPLPPGVIEAISAAAPGLAATRPALYLAFLMFSRFGLRNCEIVAARWSWIARNGKGPKIGILKRPEEGFRPKHGTERWIPLGEDVVAELEKYRGPSPDGDFIIPARTKTERHDIVYEEHGAWVGQWIKDRTKVSYELRRHAGSLIFHKVRGGGRDALPYVQGFLGHADIATTMLWYWYLLDEIPSLGMADFAV